MEKFRGAERGVGIPVLRGKGGEVLGVCGASEFSGKQVIGVLGDSEDFGGGGEGSGEAREDVHVVFVWFRFLNC